MSGAEDQDRWTNWTPGQLLKEAEGLTERFKATHDHSLVPRIQALRQASHEWRRVTPAEMQCEPSKFCVKCGLQLPPNSNYCGSCGVNQVTLAKTHPAVRPFFKWLAACTILGLIVLVAICGANDTSSQPDKALIVVKVVDTCEAQVRQNLKAPSTAKFSGIWNTEVKDHGSGKYSARGWVESQNSFGAMLRNEYICMVKDAGSNPWIVTAFSVGDEGWTLADQ
jgi:hypothetical protein